MICPQTAQEGLPIGSQLVIPSVVTVGIEPERSAPVAADLWRSWNSALRQSRVPGRSRPTLPYEAGAYTSGVREDRTMAPQTRMHAEQGAGHYFAASAVHDLEL